jgi:hypothetical protein
VSHCTGLTRDVLAVQAQRVRCGAQRLNEVPPLPAPRVEPVCLQIGTPHRAVTLAKALPPISAGGRTSVLVDTADAQQMIGCTQYCGCECQAPRLDADRPYLSVAGAGEHEDVLVLLEVEAGVQQQRCAAAHVQLQ